MSEDNPAPALSAATSAGRRYGSKGIARREAIMDAAEAVFSERGYYGSSMREVSARCGAALGLINHYFSSKEVLFQEVVARRLPVLREVVRNSLADAMRTRPGDPLATIKAFLEPFVRNCIDDRDGLKIYNRMTSHFMSSYRVPEVRPALSSLKAVSDLLVDALRPLLPELSDEQFEIGLYLIEAALIFMVQDMGFLESLSNGHFDAERVDRLLDPAAAFFAAGSAALSNRT